MDIASFLLLLSFSQGLALTIDSKLDLPSPLTSLKSNENDDIPIIMDSSLSPKIVKAYYEINFVQVSKPEPSKSHVVITDSKGCPYSKELCKYYFAPSKVSIVQKVEDLIQDSKKGSDVPVVEGLAITDEDKLLKEVTPKVLTSFNKSKGVSRPGSNDGDVPVYRGSVNVEGVLNRPEAATVPDYRPHYPEVKRQCFQGACWRTYY